jgi:hypothetical protein
MLLIIICSSPGLHLRFEALSILELTHLLHFIGSWYMNGHFIRFIYHMYAGAKDKDLVYSLTVDTIEIDDNIFYSLNSTSFPLFIPITA